MARRLSLALILACAALSAPAAAGAATDLHVHDQPAAEPATAKDALRLARRIRDGKGVETGRELTPVLRVIAAKLPQLHGAERRSAERMLARPTIGQGGSGESTYTVPEAPPECGPHFCVHYVASTADAPNLTDSDGNGFPDYVDAMLREFENVYNVENVQMGWAPPKPDGGAGGDFNKTDVYIKNIGPDGLYGYASPDDNQAGQQWQAYLVMDNDYAEPAFTSRYSSFLPPLQVTAAHEYNHVLQFNYDALQDSWMFEATATWMEDKVYDNINDYVGYLNEWAKRSTQPLTQFNPPESGDSNSKVYGDAVFNRWIDEHYGADTVRRAWEVSLQTNDFAPGAYQKALNEKGTNFYDVFTQFAADTAEWRAANSQFEEGNTWPDVERALNGDSLAPQNRTGNRNDFVNGGLDHTAYALLNVDAAGQNSITVGGTFRRGTAGALAVVGRTGDVTSGNAVTKVVRLPNGGPGKVTLPNAGAFTRVTAVLINGDVSIDGYNRNTRDWNWTADSEPVTLAVNDFTKPTVRKTTPKRNARRVSTRTRVTIQFNESVAGVSPSNIRLIGPGGRSTKVATTLSSNGRVVKLVPTRGLAHGKRYTVKLSSGVTDAGGNALPTSRRIFRFTTAR